MPHRPPLAAFRRQYTHHGMGINSKPAHTSGVERKGWVGRGRPPVVLLWSVVRNGSGRKSSDNGGDRPGSFSGSKRRPMWSMTFRWTSWVPRPGMWEVRRAIHSRRYRRQAGRARGSFFRSVRSITTPRKGSVPFGGEFFQYLFRDQPGVFQDATDFPGPEVFRPPPMSRTKSM
ncbi:MAG: hypothetical protein H6Q82_632 [Deltaproteobacteria bacterium]|nr:hypothetical protein [Deltaproteobacteria bacterium]